uniref:Uncharacterized protein n=1 Tax=Romanomermis culicivorax TaxID=13658 RepID=A0A915I3C7_ROMCU
MVVPPLTPTDKMLIEKYNVKDVHITLENIDHSSNIDSSNSDLFNDNIFENLLNLKPSTSYSMERTDGRYSSRELNFEKTAHLGHILDVFMRDISIEPRISLWTEDIPFIDECGLIDSSPEKDDSIEFENIIPEENKPIVAALQSKENNSIFRTIMNSVQSGLKKVVEEVPQPGNNRSIVQESICDEPKKRPHSPTPSPRIGVKKARNDAARSIVAQSKNILNKQSPAKAGRKRHRSKQQMCNVQKSFILSRPLPDFDPSYEPKSILRSSPTKAKSHKKVLFNDGRNETFHIKRLLDCHLYQDESSMEIVTRKQCSSLSTMDQFLLAILRWNPIWFNEYTAVINAGHEANLPPIFNENLKLEKEMPTTFDSFDEYQQAMLPFVILEVWDN